jgi:hypothetical protein
MQIILFRLFKLVTGILIMAFTGCNQSNDTSVKTDLGTKAKAETDFAGVRFTVEKGVVTLRGKCATKKSMNKVEETARQLFGVKNVVNELEVAPVVIGTDFLLKQAVDSVLMKYPAVEGITTDSVVLIKGKTETAKLSELVGAVRSLGPRRIEQDIQTYNRN